MAPSRRSVPNPFGSILIPAAYIEKVLPLSIKIRKVLILICRSETNPFKRENRFTSLSRQCQILANHPSINLDSLECALSYVLESRLRIALLKSWILSAPVSYEQQVQVRKEMVVKELSTMESTPRIPVVAWESILSGNTKYQVDDGQHPMVSSTTHRKIHIWASRLEKKVIYPHYGTKYLAVGSERTIDAPWCNQGNPISSIQAEWLYMKFGQEGSSPCQLKQAWTPGIMVPRTYYAQGLDAFHSSKYIRDIFNQLADLFRNVNRFNRVRPQMISADSSDTLYIYDLTSFSSMFHEHRNFLLALAQEVEGYNTTIFDSYHGESSVSLSFLIREYVKFNVTHPSYTTLMFPILDSLDLQHNVAGFLGVYGNLITCTIPHGILLATVNDDWHNNWCAGDDAGCAICKEKHDRLDRTIRKAGSYAEEKVFIGNEEGAVALKRPILFDRGLVIFRNTPLFPLLGLFTDPDRFNVMHAPDEFYLIRLISSSMISFLISCAGVRMEQDHKDEMFHYIKRMFTMLGITHEGWLPHVCGTRPYRYTIPIIDAFMFDKDPFDRLIGKYYRNSYRDRVREDRPVSYSELFVLGVASGNMTDWLRWAKDMGIVSSEPEYEYFEGSAGKSRLRSVLFVSPMHLPSTVYRFMLIDGVRTCQIRGLEL